MTDTSNTAEFTCTGFRHYGTNRGAMLFIGPNGAECTFNAKRKTRKYVPGGVYRFAFDRKPDGTVKSIVFPNSPGTAFVREHGDRAQTAAWKVLHDAALAAERAHKKHEELKASVRGLEAMAPIRDAWRRTDRIGQRAIEATVLAYLRGL